MPTEYAPAYRLAHASCAKVASTPLLTAGYYAFLELVVMAAVAMLLTAFTSPVLSMQEGQTIHASLSLTVEPAPAEGGIDAFYQAIRSRLGDNLVVLSHEEWAGGGYVDVMRTETSVAVSYIKRFFRVEGARGISLAFESRDDVFWRVDPWADLIASTLQVEATDGAR